MVTVGLVGTGTPTGIQARLPAAIGEDCFLPCKLDRGRQIAEVWLLSVQPWQCEEGI